MWQANVVVATLPGKSPNLGLPSQPYPPSPLPLPRIPRQGYANDASSRQIDKNVERKQSQRNERA